MADVKKGNWGRLYGRHDPQGRRRVRLRLRNEPHLVAPEAERLEVLPAVGGIGEVGNEGTLPGGVQGGSPGEQGRSEKRLDMAEVRTLLLLAGRVGFLFEGA